MKYRIIQKQGKYHVQRKSMFGWVYLYWGCGDFGGTYYDTLQEAEQRIESDKVSRNKVTTVVREYN